MINFNDQLHEQIFILFICYSNSTSFNENKWGLPVSDDEMIDLQYIIGREYLLDFSNRNIHEERVEYDGWVSDYGMLAIQTTGCGFEIQQRDDSYYFKNKIKFYFVDENKQGE